jgi:hypothetical protein
MAAFIGNDRQSFVVAAHPFWADASKPNFSMR